MPVSDYLKTSNWIWTGESYAKERPVLVSFRKKLTLESVPERFVVRLSADSRYRFYVNGVSLVQGPCKGDAEVWYYDEVDLAPYLKRGENQFAATVLRYPENGNGNHAVWRTGTPGFYLSGALEADASWKARVRDDITIEKANPYFEPLCIFEKAAGSLRFYGWLDADFDDSGWADAMVYYDMQISKSISPGHLTPRPIPFLYEKERKFDCAWHIRESALGKESWDALLQKGEALVLPAHHTEIVEISAGELTTGYLRLLLADGAGAKVELLQSECYGYPVEGGMMGHTLKKGDRTDAENGVLEGFTDTYTAGGFGTAEKPESYSPFWFRTFRFIQLKITTGDAPLTLLGFDYIETGYPLEPKTEVSVSDETLIPVWEISMRTLRRCMHETYEDCPFYEQLQYAMDSRSEILFTYAVAADDRMARRTLDDFFRSMREDGLINCCYPSYGPNVIPGFSIYYILMIHDHMMYFGDQKLVRRYFPAVMQILTFFENRIAANGLVTKTSEGGMGKRYWSFIDWTERWDAGVPNAIRCGYVTMDTLQYILGLQAGAELAEYLGLSDYAAQCREKAAAAQKAVRKNCMDAEGILTDGPGFAEYSQHVQAFATITGTYSDAEAVKAMTAAMDRDYTLCSVAMGYYLCRALEKTGLYARTNEMWELWRVMIRNKMTTCIEAPGDTARSECHAWSALPLYELPAVTLGVRPASPGYETISVRPTPGYMTHAEGNVITPHGMLHVRWELKDGKCETAVEAEENVKKRLV